MSLHNWIFELRENYRTATDRLFNLSPPCARPTGGVRTPARPPGRPRIAPPTKPHARPQVEPKPLCPGFFSARHAPPPTPLCDTPPTASRSPATPSSPSLARPPLGRCAPARSPQFALLPLPAPIKGVGFPLHARTARPRHSQLRRAQAHRGAPYSGHPRPESTPEMEPHHPPEALRCILSLIPSPEHERR